MKSARPDLGSAVPWSRSRGCCPPWPGVALPALRTQKAPHTHFLNRLLAVFRGRGGERGHPLPSPYLPEKQGSRVTPRLGRRLRRLLSSADTPAKALRGGANPPVVELPNGRVVRNPQPAGLLGRRQFKATVSGGAHLRSLLGDLQYRVHVRCPNTRDARKISSLRHGLNTITYPGGPGPVTSTLLLLLSPLSLLPLLLLLPHVANSTGDFCTTL